MPGADGTLTAEEKAAEEKKAAEAAAKAQEEADRKKAEEAARSGNKDEIRFPNAAALMQRVKREAKKQQTELLAALGVKDVEELKAKLAASPAPPASAPANGGGNGNGKASTAKLEQENAQLRAENDRLRQQLKSEGERRNRIHLNAEIDKAAIRAGMKAAEYIQAARVLLMNEISKKKGNENVDLDAWFANLKKERPALFESSAKPANSGTTGSAPGAPVTGGGTSPKSAFSMTDEELRAKRRELGLTT